ncbi:uncharacterized protein BP01DRAFT_355771 [Aspergillus saccharolyticus JOP 1030-1]|uniref:Uncharacterized protein n=1 Tax=Aspergillus saccharolyticus JOP 1030-1 TaxID=1450539 RepID=A0A318ZFD7_9EURO|nr:hypothetical protein BP01DRAFT_355771 [Aspergillus saccharolyticus JOP 1030-1]PYH46129.1 hypothetical protein BP01DRAFT_355771 [Aspergillus saccharolyticus JOP 1030-1]
MDSWQRNTRMMHHIGEFFDLDPDKSDMVADFIALIEALREGLTLIDDGFHIPDSHINLLFLTKLKECPRWSSWATTMLRDSRVNASNPGDRMSFQELADLARKQESLRQLPGRRRQRDAISERDFAFPQRTSIGPDTLTQDDINAFIVRRMTHDEKMHNRNRSIRGHNKRPSQEEINDYVIQQMQREEADKSHDRQQAQAPSRQPRTRPTPCSFCGDKHHQVANCWRRWRVAVEAPQGQFVPKRVDYKFQLPGQPPMYRSGFTLF